MATTSDAARQNPLLAPLKAPYGTLPFTELSAQDYEEAIKEGIRQQNQEIQAITSQRSTPTFENTIVALDRSGNLLFIASQALSNLEHALGDTLLMKALADVTPLLSEHQANIMLNDALFQRIKEVYDRRDQRSDLTSEDQRLLEETYKSFALNGANLTGKDREKYRKLMAELSDLNVRFAQNVTNDMKNPQRRLWLNKSQLGGLPESIIAAARHEAADALAAEGKEDNPDSFLFTVFYPSYAPFMKYSTERDLRRQLYKMYTSRNNGGEFDNNQILKDIANIRLQIAQLMGKKNFAEYQLQETMAGTPENVYAMLGELRDNYTEPMKKEIAEIQDYARQSEGADFVLMPWDYSFWSDKLKNEKYAFNDEDMKPYFELNNTIKGVFGLATKLYGYTFKENKNIPVYHADVKAYDVYGPDKKLLGVLYTDFFYRPGKAPGAWMTEYRTEYKDDNGVKTVPLISLVTNFTKPVGKEPVLLTPYEVETFLHEFGHCLHGLSAEAKYASLSGTNVYHDFVELFSQFNENFLSQKQFLDSFAKHYKTGKKIPQGLVDKFVNSSHYGAAYACIRQLGFGYLDMAYHTIEEPLRASADIPAFENNALEPVKIFDAVEGCVVSPSFAHVFSGGYAAGYYGYKWSEELDADAFAAFLDNGIYDKKTATKFRKMMQAGGTVDPMTLYIEFRGKKPSVDALLKRDGLK
ncbi:MAG: M3 family metallopeptidase [Clostridium sp.]|nr:M3 family metallopeptidase [Prevotella sp.]MCM1428754.1 M3 family metallopeptidase [Clostridium sp.]